MLKLMTKTVLYNICHGFRFVPNDLVCFDKLSRCD